MLERSASPERGAPRAPPRHRSPARARPSRLPALALLIVLGIPSACQGEEATPIVAPGAQLERVFDGGHFLEGPAAAPDGSIYFCDITFSSQTGMQAGHIWRFDPESGRTTLFRSPSGMAQGIAFDAKGRMLVAEGSDFGGRRVTRTEMRTGKSYVLAGLFEGRPFNSPNDLAIDRSGRVYFTDPRYLGHEPIEQPVMGIYRIDPDGSVHRIVSELWKPNGIAISPDQKTLYVATVGTFTLDRFRAGLRFHRRLPPSAIHCFDLHADGTVDYRKELVAYPKGQWTDGITIDAEGNLYAAVSGPESRRGVHVYSPSGEELAHIPTPENAANLAFGRGDDSDLLYVTATTGLYRIRLNRAGYQLPERPGGR
jgi:gluconolactonase